MSYTLTITTAGAAALADAIANGNKIIFGAVALSGVDASTLTPASNNIGTEFWRGTPVEVTAVAGGQLRIRALVPVEVGGWTSRTIGIFAGISGVLLAYSAMPLAYKPLPSQDSAGQLWTLDCLINVGQSNASAVVAPAAADWLVVSVAGKKGDVTLTPSDVGLDNVENTADMDKPVSTAVTQTLANYYTRGQTDAAILSSLSGIETGFLKDKGSVDTYSDLPMSGNNPGDMYSVTDTGTEYYWLMSGWNHLDFTVDLTPYSTTVETQADIAAAISSATGNLVTTDALTTALAQKQNTLTAGAGITISDGVISATGGTGLQNTATGEGSLIIIGNANNNTFATSVGSLSSSQNYGTALGFYSSASTQSLAIGAHSVANTYGTSLGYIANVSSSYGIAIGRGATVLEAGAIQFGNPNGIIVTNSTANTMDVAGRRITSVIDPENPQDAATKNYVDSRDVYSMTAVDTGKKWIDGKTIYRQAFQGNIVAAANTNADVTLLGSGISNCIKYFGWFQDGSDWKRVIPCQKSGLENSVNVTGTNSIVFRTYSSNARTGTTNNAYQIVSEYTLL